MKRGIIFGIFFVLFAQAVWAQSTTTNLEIGKPQAGQAQPSVTIATGFDQFDAAVAGRLSKSVAGGSSVTLTTTEARNAILEFTGTLTGSINVIVPTKARKYIIYNNTSGAFTLTVKTAAGTGIAVTQGTRAWLYCDATNVVSVTASGGGTINSTDGRLPYRANSTTFADAPLARVDADTMEQANSTNAQVFNVYGTKTDASNYVRLNLAPTSSEINISAGTAGTGADDLTINLVPAGIGVVSTTRALEVNEISAPATPASGKVRLYAKSDGLLYSKDDAGAETLVSGGSGGGSPSWSAITNPSGNLSLAMGSNLTTLTWGSNFSTSSAFKLAGADTSATGPLFHVSTGVSNNIIPVLIEPRGGQAFKITELGNVVLGAPSPIASSTTGFPYLPVIQSNAEPTGTPTSITGAAPLVVESDAIFGTYRLWLYAGSAWRNITPVYAGGTGTPSISAGAGAGTSPTVSVAGTNLSHEVTITTGTTPTASATVVTITFETTNGSLPTAPFCIFQPSNGNAATLTGNGQVYLGSRATGNYTIAVGSTNLTASTQYKWNVHCYQ